MRIQVQARGFSVTEALRDQAERRLRFALGSLAGQIRSVNVLLDDQNGPRGGVDKRCKLRVVLDTQPAVVIEHLESDVYVAIDRASERASRTLARRLQRAGNLRRDASLSF